MSMLDAFGYDGKRVAVVGGATGMGAAAAELALAAGAEVVVLDRAQVTQEGVTTIALDLSERASIDAAVAALGGPVDALFACAGVADGTPGIERINFVGHRYLIDRLLDENLLPRGSSICFISSTAGLGWEADLDELLEVLEIHDFDEATDWMVKHGKANYMGTKRTVGAYVAHEAMALLRQGVRVNAICPGPTDTPLAQANAATWLGTGADYRAELGIEASQPVEQAYPLLFLCSAAAAAISGITLISDAGWTSSGLTGSFPPATMIAKIMLGRIPIPSAPPAGGDR
jgi:NAD(P)-dependent dehydrogenase (short-subunit alcohol dehydrogenase family)